jgi:hypothetical protein
MDLVIMNSEPATGGTPPSDVVPNQKGPASEPQWSSKIDEPQRYSDTTTVLYSEQRSPVFLEGLSSSQLIATGTSEGPPGKSEVRTGAYFSDKHTERMTRFGDTPRDAFLRQLADRLPEGVTVAIGGEVSFKQPGRGAVSHSVMRTYARGEYGTSISLSAGNKIGSAFISVSGNSRSQDVLAGGSVSLGRVSLQAALNLTEAMRGTLAYEVGLSAPIKLLGLDADGLSVEGNPVVEVSIEVRPVEIAYDTFVKVLGPLTDYRNFVDPLSRY